MSLYCFRNAVLWVCLAGSSVALGQRLSVGVKGGTPLHEPSRLGEDDSRRYVVGATAEFGAWRGLSLEVDFLYRRNGLRVGNTFVPGNPVSTGTVNTGADVFELPVLGKYTFRRDTKVQPFVLTGYSFRKAHIETQFVSVDPTGGAPTVVEGSFSGWSRLDVGAAFGAGLAFRVGRVTISPEVRYVRWGGTSDAVLSRNQGDLLVGITF